MAIALYGCDKKKEEAMSQETPFASQVQEVSEAVPEKEATETEQQDAFSEESSQEMPQKPASPHPVHMGLWGSCGGTGFLFDMNGTKGSYIPYDMAEAREYGERRQLELVSYNPSDGICTINAFLKGKYIGQFQGIFEEEEVEVDEHTTHLIQAYNGIFTSVNGAKLDFHFHYD